MPIDEIITESGMQHGYEVEGKYMLVTDNIFDRSHVGQPHWEAGPAKDPLRLDNYGRWRVVNQKVKVNYSPIGRC